MIRWKLLDQAQTPGSGVELRLYQHDHEYAIKAGNVDLINSRVHGSEDDLARLGCQKLAGNSRAAVLIGGLGMGYTVRAALDLLGTGARVVVAELVPAVVKWNRGVLAHLAGRPLEDQRVFVQERDVAQVIQAARGSYHAILLDVDNGPQALMRPDNDWLYRPAGLNAARAALRPQGIMALWSSGPDAEFCRRLRQAGFEVDEFKVRARGRRGGGHHIIWTARRV